MNPQEYLDAVKDADIAISRRNSLAQELETSLVESGVWTQKEINASLPQTNKKIFQSDGEFWEIEWSPSLYGPTIGNLRKITKDNTPSLK